MCYETIIIIYLVFQIINQIWDLSKLSLVISETWTMFIEHEPSVSWYSCQYVDHCNWLEAKAVFQVFSGAYSLRQPLHSKVGTWSSTHQKEDLCKSWKSSTGSFILTQLSAHIPHTETTMHLREGYIHSSIVFSILYLKWQPDMSGNKN